MLVYPTVTKVISNAVDKLRERQAFLQKEKDAAAFHRADELRAVAVARFTALKEELDAAFAPLGEPLACQISTSSPDTAHYYLRQVAATGEHFSYQPDPKTHRQWVRFRIEGERHTDIIISFHCVEPTAKGLMAASAFLQFVDVVDGNRRPATETHPLGVAHFRFSGREDAKNLAAKFGDWLNATLAQGLAKWEAQL